LQKADRDPLALAKYKEDRKDLRQKDQQNFEQRFQFDPTINNVTPFKQLDESVLDPKLGFWENLGIGMSGVVGPMGAQVGTNFGEGEAETYARASRKSTNLQEILANPELVKDYGIMPQLMNEFVSDEVSKLNPDPVKAQQIYLSKYGSDKEWTRNFDKQVMGGYNRELPNHSRVQPTSMVIPFDNGGEDIITTAYSALKSNPGQVQVFELGTENYMSAAEAGITGDELVVEKETGRGNRLTQDVRYVTPQPFVPNGGILLSKEGRQFVIVDQDEKRNTFNKMMGEAYSGIYRDGKNFGNMFPIGSDKNGEIQAMPRLKYIPSGGRKIEKMDYLLFQNGQPYTDEKGNQRIYDDAYTNLIRQIPLFKEGLYKKQK